MRVVMLGLPGAGKGTQADRLAAHLGIPRVATGDMFRQAVREGTPLGRQAKAYMDRGELVPDEVTVGIVRERLQAPDCQRGFVLDGFPRNLPQARRLDSVLAEWQTPLQAAIELHVPDGVAVQRITGRRVCQQCGATYAARDAAGDAHLAAGRCPQCGGPVAQRADDSEAVVLRRLRIYQDETQPLLDFYRARGILLQVDGLGTVEEIFDRLRDVLRQRGLM